MARLYNLRPKFFPDHPSFKISASQNSYLFPNSNLPLMAPIAAGKSYTCHIKKNLFISSESIFNITLDFPSFTYQLLRGLLSHPYQFPSVLKSFIDETSFPDTKF